SFRVPDRSVSYPLSLHDALPICAGGHTVLVANSRGPETIDAEVLEFGARAATSSDAVQGADVVILSIPFARIPTLANLLASEVRSEEHTSELQSLRHLVCRLLLE